MVLPQYYCMLQLQTDPVIEGAYWITLGKETHKHYVVNLLGLVVEKKPPMWQRSSHLEFSVVWLLPWRDWIEWRIWEMAEGRLALNGPTITGSHTTDLVRKEVELKPAAWPRTETDWFSSGLTMIAAADSVTFRVPPTYRHIWRTRTKKL